MALKAGYEGLKKGEKIPEEYLPIATPSLLGCLKAANSTCFIVGTNGVPSAVKKTATEYESLADTAFIGAGTLKNVLAVKIPTPTADDEGKVLKVVDGVATWVTLE